MSNKMIHTPEGVQDIYGKEFTRKNNIKSGLHQCLTKYGYSDIETPTFEFSDVYSNEVGTTPEKEMYRFFDKEGSMLVLRPDFTPSIARSAAKYFVDDCMPVRLCYEGNVFNNTSDLQGKLKESTQMGAELIGMGDRAVADGELICLCIESLLNIGLKDFQISVGNAMYFKGICDEMDIDEESILTLREYISQKNMFGARSYLESLGAKDKHIDAILDVTKLTSFKDLDSAKSMVDNARSLEAIRQLEELYSYVCSYGLEKYISVDLGLLSKFNYYTGIIFKAFTYGTGDAIVKGGRYDTLISKFGKDASAVGLVFLVDDIMSAMSFQKLFKDTDNKLVWVVYDKAHKDEALKRVGELRVNGVSASPVLVKSDRNIDDYKANAEKYGVSEFEFYM